MPNLPGHEIARRATELLRASPGLPAIEILDLAMSGRHDGRQRGTEPGDAPLPLRAYLDPPSPFAELLRRAFAPGMDPRELLLIGLHGRSDAPDLQAAVEQASDRWQAVVELFAERYRLWEARG